MNRSGNVTRRARGGCSRGIGVGAAFLLLALCGVGACVLFLFLPNLYDPDGQAVPRVQIRVPSPGAQMRVEDGQTVMIQTSTAGNIIRYELWVDGKLTSYQMPSAGDKLPLITQLIWVPSTAGTHVLVARAFDEHNRIGTSSPIVVDAVGKSSDDLVGVTVEAQPGDTLTSIAEAFAIAPDEIRRENPGVPESPQPGEQVIVPVPPDHVPPEYEPSDEGVQGNVPPPGDGLAPPPLPEGEGQGPASPAEEGSAGDLPWDLGPGVGAPDPPVAPAELTLELTGGCGVRLTWSDNSINETGFRVYRSSAGGNFSAIQDFDANDALAELTYDDMVPLSGHYEYYVAAVNDGGESPGPIAGIDVPDADCALEVLPQLGTAAVMLQFEALDLTTQNDFDSAYCFLSLARLDPHGRIPRLEDKFLEHENAGWNIADWAAGLQRYAFYQDPAQPVSVEISCWGMRLPDETYNLGMWAASHPPEEWDGRDLHGDAEGFHIRYRIEGYQNDPPRAWEVVDGRIPPPYDVRMAWTQVNCVQKANLPGGNELYNGEGRIGLWACAEMAENMIIWDWTENAQTTRGDLTGFRVFINRDYAANPREDQPETWEVLGESGSINQIFPIPKPSCGQIFGFKVQAYVADSPERESPFISETLKVMGDACQNRVLVRVTLEKIEVTWTDDGWVFCCYTDHRLEAYGTGELLVAHPDDTMEVVADFTFWSEEPCGYLSGCVGTPGPSWLGIGERNELDLGGNDLICVGTPTAACEESGNSVILTLREGDELRFFFDLYDYDVSFDDIWCGVSTDWEFGTVGDLFPLSSGSTSMFGPYSLNGWAAVDEDWVFENNPDEDNQDAGCTLTAHAHGLGRVP